MLSGGHIHDSSVAVELISKIDTPKEDAYFIMDRAYISKDIRDFLKYKGFIHVVPPKSNCVQPWSYDKQIYKKRNEIERYFRKLKSFRKIFTRYDKLDIMYSSYIFFAIIIIALHCVNRP